MCLSLSLLFMENDYTKTRKTFEDEESSLDVGIQELDNAVKNLSDTLQLNQGDALLLLISNKWDTAAAVDFFVSDEIGARKLAGIQMNNPLKQSVVMPTECGVCFDTLPTDNSSNSSLLSCGHGFCKDCWTSQLAVKVKERPTKGVVCMWPKCNHPVSEEVRDNLYIVFFLFLKYN